MNNGLVFVSHSENIFPCHDFIMGTPIPFIVDARRWWVGGLFLFSTTLVRLLKPGYMKQNHEAKPY